MSDPRPLTVPFARFVLLAGLAALAQASADAQPIVFTERAAASGVVWSQVDNGSEMGAGCAFFDANGDGLLDVLLAGGKGAPGLFRNQGGGLFTDQSVGAGFQTPLPGQFIMGPFCADHDDDGDTDVFIAASGHNQLYRNDGATFTGVTSAAGLIDTRWGATAAWGDYDQDGDLDLFVGNYVTIPSQPTPNILYRNEGNGTFTNVTVATGVGGNATTLASEWSDVDQDGDPDLWVGNDLGQFLHPNRLWRNDGAGAGPNDWQFQDVAPALGADAVIYCMGVASGDIDRDGDLDAHFTNIGPKLLLRNDGAAGYADVSAATGTEGTHDPYQPTEQTTSWGNGFHDFDRDGWIDLYVAHGYITPPGFVPSAQNAQNVVNHLYRHDGPALTFSSVGAGAGVEDTLAGRGAAFGDYDGDGDVDILQASIDGPALLYRNDTVAPGHRLSLGLEGRLSNRDGIGTFVRAEAAGATFVREVKATTGFVASSESDPHVGLGAASEVLALTLRWPSGQVQDWFHVAVDQKLVMREPLLTWGTGSVTPSAVAEGNVLQLSLDIENATGDARTTWILMELRFGPAHFVSGVIALPVPAAGKLTLPVAIAVPPGVTGGTAFDVEFVWSAYDAGLGLDQLRHVVSVTP